MTEILQGNIIDLADDLVRKAVTFQSIITSPPYWALRDYGTPHQSWPAMKYSPMPGLPEIAVPAWKGELGQEPDINMFVAHLILCFRKLRPLLRDDGTLWVNLGDSYFATGKTSNIATGTLQGRKQEIVMPRRVKKQSSLIPNKNRCGIPERFRLAMQADGWYWRDLVIWAKTSPMPGSQTDRCTVAHEDIMMFSKKPRYFYDYHAIQEKCSGNAHSRGKGTTPKSGKNKKGVRNNDSFSLAVKDLTLTRNPRSVWTISSEPSKENHFASWPAKLAARMIKASTSEHGCCSACGAPWRKIIVRERVPTRPGTNSKLKNVAGWAKGKGIPHDTIAHTKRREERAGLNPDSPYWEQNGKIHGNRDPLRHTTTLLVKGWEPTCTCNAGIEPCSVLDPFGGTGKTALAAERLFRKCTLFELQAEYAQRARENLEKIRAKELGMFS